MQKVIEGCHLRAAGAAKKKAPRKKIVAGLADSDDEDEDDSDSSESDSDDEGAGAKAAAAPAGSAEATALAKLKARAEDEATVVGSFAKNFMPILFKLYKEHAEIEAEKSSDASADLTIGSSVMFALSETVSVQQRLFRSCGRVWWCQLSC